MSKVNEKIFHKYDIRGIYPNDFDEMQAFLVVRALINLTGAKTILVGQDVRTSSPQIAKSVINAAGSLNCSVLDIGQCSTPSFGYAVIKLKPDVAIMITASHLDSAYNGLKPVLKGNIAMTEELMHKIKELAVADTTEYQEFDLKVNKTDIKDDYIATAKLLITQKINDYKIIVDCGNASTALYANDFLSGYNLNYKILFENIDGNFPNRNPNPKDTKSRKKLKEEVINSNADLGFILDADGDRVMILDQMGELIDPNFVASIIACHMIKKYDKKQVVLSINSSRIIEKNIKLIDGKAIYTPVWYTNIKNKLRQLPDAVFGAESSSHYVYPQFNYIDDGLVSILIFLEAISNQPITVKELIENYKKQIIILEEANFKITDAEKITQMLESIKSTFSQEKNIIINEIDGLTMQGDTWKFNIRSSVSEPYLRLNLDADNQIIFDEKLTQLKTSIEK